MFLSQKNCMVLKINLAIYLSEYYDKVRLKSELRTSHKKNIRRLIITIFNWCLVLLDPSPMTWLLQSKKKKYV